MCVQQFNNAYKNSFIKSEIWLQNGIQLKSMNGKTNNRFEMRVRCEGKIVKN